MTEGADHASQGLFAERDIAIERRPDGSAILTNRLELAPSWPSIVHAVRHWVEATPDAAMIAEWRGNDFEYFTYRGVWDKATTVRDRLAEAGAGPDRPVMILAPNGLDHWIVALAAMRIAAPVVPVSMGYCAPGADPARLQTLVGVAAPAVAFAAESVAPSVLRGLGDLPVLRKEIFLADGGAAGEPDAIAIGPDTIAKLLFTSGSTGAPKAVINTHGMLCANQAMLSTIWPGIDRRPPILLDWLPWSHTFGGNFTFHFAVMRGGTYHVDAGRPAPGQMGPTLAALEQISPTAYFNVPAGFEALIPHLEAEPELASRLFARLDFVFSAAAAMPQTLRDRIGALARRTIGREVPIVGGWGSTETAPCATGLWFQTDSAASIGAPLPGVAIKLAPVQDKLELRVRGPNVMPGYWKQSDASAAAFDDEGFLRMGDAGVLADPGNPGEGVIFDGRLAENFKLRSGTWVNVGALRLAILEACRPALRDLAITGHGQSSLAALIFPDPVHCGQIAGQDLDHHEIPSHPAIIEYIRSAIAAHNDRNPGSSTSIAQFLILPSPPQPGIELTDKGYLNQRATLSARSEEVAMLDAGNGIATR